MIYSNVLHNPWLKFNLGNQLFVIASILGMSKRYNTNVGLMHEWEYQDYFKLTDVLVLERSINIVFMEPEFSYSITLLSRKSG